MEHTCCMCGVKFDLEFTTQRYCTDCNKDIGQVMQFNHAIPEDKMDEHSIYVEIEDLRSRVRVLEVELKRERSIKHIITPNPILNDLTYEEEEKVPKNLKDLKGKSAYTFVKTFISLLDKHENTDVDNIETLSSFLHLAKFAKGEITNE